MRESASRGGNRPKADGRKKRRVIPKGSDLLDSQEQCDKKEDPRTVAAHNGKKPVGESVLDQQEGAQSKRDHLGSRMSAENQAQEGGSGSRSNRPETVSECDDLLRRVRVLQQDGNLSEAERENFVKYEARVLKRRQLLVHREQADFLTGEMAGHALFAC